MKWPNAHHHIDNNFGKKKTIKETADHDGNEVLAYMKCSMILPTPQFGHFVEITSIRTKVNDFGQTWIERYGDTIKSICIKSNKKRRNIDFAVLQVPNVERTRPKFSVARKRWKLFHYQRYHFANAHENFHFWNLRILCTDISLKIELFRQAKCLNRQKQIDKPFRNGSIFFGAMITNTCKCKMHSES